MPGTLKRKWNERGKKRLKLRNLTMKTSALLLAAAMIITAAPQFRAKVYAAELPDRSQFATVEQLTAFSTDGQDGSNTAKVYYGGNDQQWWIAGSQNDNLTLFAASPLVADEQQFAPNLSEKPYSADWKCGYASSPANVDPNHYGASPLRSALKDLETSYFTEAERALMKNTTIYTDDIRNRMVYSTTDKLYLAYGAFSAGNVNFITVGENSPGGLNDGLRVERRYWGKSGFWLRAPYEGDSSHTIANNSDYALVALPDSWVYVDNVSHGRAVTPAFELDPSSVLFSSAAPAAASDGRLGSNDAMTLRYRSDKLGLAELSFDKQSVALTDVPEDTYLVVQNSEGTWAKRVSGSGSVSASDMGWKRLESFANCKVWLENSNTDERKTYATMAAERTGHNVTINAGQNMTVTNGAQTKVTGAIADITAEAKEGYYLPGGYQDSVTGLNGLRITQNGNAVKISGTPAGDVQVTLRDAMNMTKEDSHIQITTADMDKIYDGKAVNEPQYTTTGSTAAVAVTWQKKAGTMGAKAANGTWIDLKNAPSDAGEYQVTVTLAEDDHFNAAEAAKTFRITPKNVKDGGITVSEINNDSDVETMTVKDGDKKLEKGTDYDVEQKKDGGKTTVTITFKGNYTGIIEKTYTVKETGKPENPEEPENPQKPENPEQKPQDKPQVNAKEKPQDTESMKTGDSSHTGLFVALSMISAGCIGVLIGKKRKKHIEE